MTANENLPNFTEAELLLVICAHNGICLLNEFDIKEQLSQNIEAFVANREADSGEYGYDRFNEAALLEDLNWRDVTSKVRSLGPLSTYFLLKFVESHVPNAFHLD